MKLACLGGLLLLGVAPAGSVSPGTNTATVVSGAIVTNLFPEGSVELLNETGEPEGWVFPDKNDRPWKAGTKVEVLAEEAGNHFLRITTVPEFPGFYAVFVNVPWIPDGKTHIQVSMRMRARIEQKPEGAPWRGFRAHLGFATGAGRADGRNWEIIAEKRLLTMDIQDSTEEWVRCVESREIPQGAKYICIRIMVGGMAGTFDVDDLVVTTE